ncbi:MAG: PIN domain-containing protein, partial [Candidatus Limnocylindria bacterium]
VKLPAALPAFRTLVDACTTPLAMAPIRTSNRLARVEEADPKDAPILAAAIAGRCRWLVTFNVRDYRTDQLRVSLPGPFLQELRAMLARHR